MGFKCGIVGLPNVGKSTLFNALTSAEIDAANYPFCTIDPNVGIVEVPDSRMDALIEIVIPQKIIPTTMEFVDIAGLVAGASKGEGLGNQFLAHIRETQAIAHVVRCFEDENIIHVDGKVDPVSDIETINTELALADMESVQKALQKVEKQARVGDKAAAKDKAVLDRVKEHLDEGNPVRSLDLDDDDKAVIYSLHLLTAKPTFYVANVDEDHLEGNELVDKVKEFAEQDSSAVLIVCAAIESELISLDKDEALEFLGELGLEEPGLNRIIHAGYDLLGLQTYFTAGVKEVRAWTVRKGATAPQAAGVIHTDFEHGFIRAEVVSYDDFVGFKGEAGAKEAGKWRLEGKEYLVQDGDVVHFRFNV